jgi:SAM-dependent methyltransferase
MGEVEDHYKNLLAKHYSWMFGASFQTKISEQKSILENALHPDRSGTGLAVDLGCGSGFQTFALCEMGYRPVVAIDTSEALLEELAVRQGDQPIRAIKSDLASLHEFIDANTARMIVCMGDTLTHLGSKDVVKNLLTQVFTALEPGGAFVITYRDLSPETTGLHRFIPVHADDDRIMTCFLEFDQPDSVLVHDLVYVRKEAGWVLEKSAYRKLRLPVAWLVDAMTSAGFVVEQGRAGRLIRLVGRKLL